MPADLDNYPEQLATPSAPSSQPPPSEKLALAEPVQPYLLLPPARVLVHVLVQVLARVLVLLQAPLPAVPPAPLLTPLQALPLAP